MQKFKIDTMRTLEETKDFMTSSDYKERFIAEYQQVKIRIEKLRKYICKIRAAETYGANVSAPHDCSLYVLNYQYDVMKDYLDILEIRAIIEKIDLE